jgi:hypothetical protein
LETLSFVRDIRPFFSDMDVEHMMKAMDLSDRDSVFIHGAAIYEAVSKGSMPPASSGEHRWTPDMCEVFRRWLDQGGPR